MKQLIALIYDILWLPVALITLILGPYLDVSDPTNIRQGEPAILLLHGSGANELSFTYARRILNEKYQGSVFSLQYDGVWMTDKKASISEFAQKVKKRCRDIMDKTNQKEIIIIGVSMGGLIGAYYKEYISDVANISKVITIGAPFHGSPLLEYIPLWKISQRHVEMRPNSKFLQELRDRMIKNLDNYFFIGSTEDLLVPFDNAIVKGGECMKFSGLGHYAFHASPSIWKFVRELIAN